MSGPDVALLILDFDNKKPRAEHLEEVLNRPLIAQHCHLWYTSFSHTPEIPRWRLILPSAEPIPLSALEEYFDRLSFYLGDDPALDSVGKKPAQIYYFPYALATREYLSGEALNNPPLDFAQLPARPQSAPPIQKMYVSVHESEEDQNVLDALSHLSPSMGYDDWIDVGLCLHSYEPNEKGLQMWLSWSSKGSNFGGEKDVRTHWKSFKVGGGKTIATLFQRAKEAGYRPGHRLSTPIHSAQETSEGVTLIPKAYEATPSQTYKPGSFEEEAAPPLQKEEIVSSVVCPPSEEILFDISTLSIFTDG